MVALSPTAPFAVILLTLPYRSSLAALARAKRRGLFVEMRERGVRHELTDNERHSVEFAARSILSAARLRTPEEGGVLVFGCFSVCCIPLRLELGWFVFAVLWDEQESEKLV